MKNNKLTLFIAFAFVLGTSVGYILNTQWINPYNEQIIQADREVKIIEAQMVALGDTTTMQHVSLKKKLTEHI